MCVDPTNCDGGCSECVAERRTPKGPRALAAMLRSSAKEPWMTIGARPFAADSARTIEELSDAVDRAVVLCREASDRLQAMRKHGFNENLVAALELFIKAYGK